MNNRECLLWGGRVTNTSQRPLLEVRIKYNTSPLVYFLDTNDHEKITNKTVTAKCLNEFMQFLQTYTKHA